MLRQRLFSSMPGNSQSVSAVIHFGPFDADLQTQELRSTASGFVCLASPFKFSKCCWSIRKPVSREELQKALWPPTHLWISTTA